MIAPGDERAPVYCRVCGGRIEEPRPGRRLCYGCHLDLWLPAGYQRREAYRWCPIDRVSRATGRPKTGREILDAPRPPEIAEIAAAIGVAGVRRLGDRERAVGADVR